MMYLGVVNQNRGVPPEIYSAVYDTPTQRLVGSSASMAFTPDGLIAMGQKGTALGAVKSAPGYDTLSRIALITSAAQEPRNENFLYRYMQENWPYNDVVILQQGNGLNLNGAESAGFQDACVRAL